MSHLVRNFFVAAQKNKTILFNENKRKKIKSKYKYIQIETQNETEKYPK